MTYDVPPILGGGMATPFISNIAEDHSHLQKLVQLHCPRQKEAWLERASSSL